MKFIPQSTADQQELLKTIGFATAEDLFKSEAGSMPFTKNLDFPKAQSELELRRSFSELAQLSKSPSSSFAGCGIYAHDIPSIVPFVTGRSEFATAYTPYQAEISQGLLQSIFEFQSLACSLTECELSNASVYDGATALAEGALMALRIRKKSNGKILVSSAIHPHYLEVLKTYLHHFLDRLEFVDLDQDRMSLDVLRTKLTNGADVLITQSPNIFGSLENYEAIGQLVKEFSPVWVTSTMEPFVFGMTRGPGSFGADIATAEGQSFGNAPYLGGSSFGFFTCKMEYLRNLPGRLVGETVDQKGRRSYTLTFATREQFIRRDKATSNICTNQNLNMLAGLVHMVTLGKSGIREVAIQNFSKSEYVKDHLSNFKALKVSPSPTFNEFCVTLTQPAAQLIEASTKEGWIAGVDLGRFQRNWANKLLIHISELHSKRDLDRLVSFLKKYD